METVREMGSTDEPLDLSLNSHKGDKKQGERYEPFKMNIPKDQIQMETDGTFSAVDEVYVPINDQVIRQEDEKADDISVNCLREDLGFNAHKKDDHEISLTIDDIKVNLQDPELWTAFNELGTEMIINRCGRRMFPHLVLRFSGLDPNGKYKLLLAVTSADDRRYKFVNNSWTPMGMADPEIQNPPFYHSDGISKGSTLMESRISFAKVKLTNNRESSDGNIVLHSMHKYIPRITLQKLTVNKQDLERQYVFSFPETIFIAVTAYQNEQITKLKIHNNPFAKAFRDGRSVNIKSSMSVNPTQYRRIEDKEDRGPIKRKRTTRFLQHQRNDELFNSTSSLGPCCSACSVGNSENGQLSYSTWPLSVGQFLATSTNVPPDMRYKMPQMPMWFPYYPLLGREMPTTAQDLSISCKKAKNTTTVDCGDEPTDD